MRRGDKKSCTAYCLSAKLSFAMADFSFSFDSDNPFAEPEQTPKKATVSGDEPAAETFASSAPADGPASTVPVADNPAPVASDFSLDAFDFAFDEDASLNDSLPTRNTPLDEAPPRQLTPGEAAFAEFDFSAPATESPVIESPVEVPVAEVEVPVADMPVADAPVVESPVVEVPVAEVEVPVAEVLVAEVEAEPLEIESLEADDLAVEMPDIEVTEPEMTIAEAQTPAELAVDEPELSELNAPELDVAAVENSAEIAALDKTSARSARSDLEEFNAFTYDFGMPDELFGPETDDEKPVANEDETGIALDETLSETAPLDFLEAEVPVAEPLIEVPAEESLVEESLVEESLVEESLVEESFAEPRRISTRDVMDDAPLLDSIEEAGLSEGQTEGEFRRLRTKATLNVAILGASGIGKNHARWFHRHGCQIVGFLGTSPETTTQTEADLSADFDFQGNAYTDLETLLQTEKPDIVCVATPPPLHFGHVLQSLEAGAHVLCEKPLVYAPTRKFRENRDGAKELVKVAAKRKLNLGTQLQYGGATPILCKLAGLTPSDVGDFAMELETTNPNSPRDPRELWIDLGPHPISIAQILAGSESQLAEETIVFEPHQDDEKTEVLARFGINCADGRLLMVRAVVRGLHGENPRKPRRRFSFNGHAVTYAPLRSAKNGFQAQFVAPDGYSSVYPDPVDYLIGNFVSACRNGEAPMITGDFGRENLEWMLKVGMPTETR